MKSINYTIITCLLLLIFTSQCRGQFIKNLDVEFGLNRSLIKNTKSLFTENRDGSSRRELKIESPLYTNNYSVSIGYKIFKSHLLRFRYAKNNFGNTLTGTFDCWTGGCGLGEQVYVLENGANIIESSSMGLMYEYQRKMNFGNILIGIGFEKHKHSYDDTRIIVPGMSLNNFALHSSLGYLIPVNKFLNLHSKVFLTRLLQNDDDIYLSTTENAYLPIQLGIEIGIRLYLKNLK